MEGQTLVDRASLIGIVLAVTAIFGGFLLEGGHLAAIVQPTAALIVLGGTTGALFLQFPMEHMRSAARDLSTVFIEVQLKPQHELVEFILKLAKKSHREGILPLEKELENISDPFLNRALTLVVDGASTEVVRECLELELDAKAEIKDIGARVFEAGGGYAPTVGILGAVLGLIHVMENLTEPEQLGSGIAVAFVATIYGVGIANLILLPIAGKIRVRNDALFQHFDLIVEGTVAIARGEHPTTLGDRLRGLMDPKEAALTLATDQRIIESPIQAPPNQEKINEDVIAEGTTGTKETEESPKVPEPPKDS